MLGYAYAGAGQRQNAEAMVQQLSANGSPDAVASLAIVQIALGDTTRALDNLERAARAAGMPLMVGEMVETRLGTTAALHVATLALLVLLPLSRPVVGDSFNYVMQISTIALQPDSHPPEGQKIEHQA